MPCRYRTRRSCITVTVKQILPRALASVFSPVKITAHKLTHRQRSAQTLWKHPMQNAGVTIVMHQSRCYTAPEEKPGPAARQNKPQEATYDLQILRCTNSRDHCGFRDMGSIEDMAGSGYIAVGQASNVTMSENIYNIVCAGYLWFPLSSPILHTYFLLSRAQQIGLNRFLP